MAFGTALANSLLDWFKGSSFMAAPGTNLYVSLHTGEPGPDGTSFDVTTAVAGGRAPLTVADLGDIADDPLGGRVITYNEQIDFTNSALAGAVITHIGLWSAASAGNFYGGGALTQVAVVQAGDIVRIPTGSLKIRAIGYIDA